VEEAIVVLEEELSRAVCLLGRNVLGTVLDVEVSCGKLVEGEFEIECEGDESLYLYVRWGLNSLEVCIVTENIYGKKRNNRLTFAF
jgi:hypothetical protein